MGDRDWREVLDRYDVMVGRQLDRFAGRPVKGTGDGVLAVLDGPARAIRAACAIRDAARQIGVESRAGIHAGEIERRGDDVAGIAVHVAARVCAFANANEVLVTRTVRDLTAGSGMSFVDRGDAIMRLINAKARIAVCGQISEYNLDEPEFGPCWFRTLIVKQAKVQGFLVSRFAERFPQRARAAGRVAEAGEAEVPGGRRPRHRSRAAGLHRNAAGENSRESTCAAFGAANERAQGCLN